MAFTETKEQFGAFTKVLVTESESGTRIVVIPEMGARLNEYLVPTKSGLLNVIDGYASADELAQEGYAKGSFLAPFPNRIADGAYTFEEKEYQLPINKEDEHNAIHGFISNKKFEVVSSAEKGDSYELVLRHTSEGADGFPFSFIVTVSYVFRGTSLTVQTEIKNGGDGNLPIGFGWHPYFTTGSKVDDLKLQMAEVEKIAVDERLIPTGEISLYNAFNSLKNIEETQFDTGFRFISEERKVELNDVEKGISICVFFDDTYNYVQLFTPPWRTSIAIEPMTCAANAFNNNIGLKVLESEETFSAEFSIEAKAG